MITKKTKPKATPAADAAAEAFIAAAPDSSQAPRRIRKGKKIQITMTLPEPVLDRVDRLAEELGQSRASIINLAIAQMLQKGLSIDGDE